jgi:hypothetical protein
MRHTLGKLRLSLVAAQQEIEWDQYRTRVTDYELQRYLPICRVTAGTAKPGLNRHAETRNQAFLCSSSPA